MALSVLWGQGQPGGHQRRQAAFLALGPVLLMGPRTCTLQCLGVWPGPSAILGRKDGLVKLKFCFTS